MWGRERERERKGGRDGEERGREGERERGRDGEERGREGENNVQSLLQYFCWLENSYDQIYREFKSFMAPTY